MNVAGRIAKALADATAHFNAAIRNAQTSRADADGPSKINVDGLLRAVKATSRKHGVKGGRWKHVHADGSHTISLTLDEAEVKPPAAKLLASPSPAAVSSGRVQPRRS